MNTFRTEIDIPQLEHKIKYSSNLLFLGSCFSDNIGAKLTENKFNTLVNPFGVIYNPISVGNSLDILIDKKTFTEDDLSYDNEKWFSFNFHSSFSNKEKNECLNIINKSICNSADFLKKADFLFITLGTAWVFNHINENRIVSNCHKLPAKTFLRNRLSVTQITSVYDQLLNKLKKLNPSLQIVFTVSPIRHWKDGAHENQLSKSTLLLAIDALQQKHTNVNYFPSYEIVMDELRDYRFYSDDMIHISNVGIEYIWSKFVESLFCDTSLVKMKEIQKIISACSHRAFNPLSDQHQKFILNLLRKINNLDLINKETLFEQELDKLKTQLIEV